MTSPSEPNRHEPSEPGGDNVTDPRHLEPSKAPSVRREDTVTSPAEVEDEHEESAGAFPGGGTVTTPQQEEEEKPEEA